MEIKKGYISTIEGPEDKNGRKTNARVAYEKSENTITAPLTIHASIRGSAGRLEKGTEVVFIVYPDRGGLVLGRADGEIFADEGGDADVGHSNI